MALHYVFVLMVFSFTGISAVRLVLSLFALDLGAHAVGVSLLYATFYLFPVLLSWPVGKHSDKVGSFRLLLVGTVLGGVGYLVPFQWQSMPALYASAALVGLSLGFNIVLLQNIVGLVSRPEQRARNFSNSSMIGALTNLVGPLLAGMAIDHFGHAYACLLLAAFPLITALILLGGGRLLPGAARVSTTATPSGPLRPEVARTLATSAIVQLGQDMYQVFTPIYGHGIGLSASAIGVVLGCYAAAAFVSRFLMPRLITLLGNARLLAYALCIAAGAFIAMPLFEHFALLAGLSFILGLGIGCGQPITTLLMFTHSPDGRSGSAMGLRQTVNNFVRMVSPPLLGTVASVSLLSVFWITGALMGAGALVARQLGAPRSR